MPIPRRAFVGARLVGLYRQGADLVLRLDDIPRFGLRFSASIALRKVTAVTATDPRAPHLTPVLRPGRHLFAWLEQPGAVAFEVHRLTGPGDADVARFRIAFRAVTVTWRPSLRATLRAWSRI